MTCTRVFVLQSFASLLTLFPPFSLLRFLHRAPNGRSLGLDSKYIVKTVTSSEVVFFFENNRDYYLHMRTSPGEPRLLLLPLPVPWVWLVVEYAECER